MTKRSHCIQSQSPAFTPREHLLSLGLIFMELFGMYTGAGAVSC